MQYLVCAWGRGCGRVQLVFTAWDLCPPWPGLGRRGGTDKLIGTLIHNGHVCHLLQDLSPGPNASHTAGTSCNDSHTILPEVSSTSGLIQHSAPYRTMEMVLIIVAAGSLSFLTVLGNVLVMISIRVNRHLQTVNNFFLFSLAFSDLVIGVFSMNFYTVYMLKGYWPFGPTLCDLWLVVDYVVSNASNMNLLVISVDRYLCVTRPLTYPSRRTRRYACLMVLGAWLVSLVLWVPAILTWQRFQGRRLHLKDECYIQLLSSPVVTMATSIPSFYLPALLMTFLYVRISRAGRRRVQGLRAPPPDPAVATLTISSGRLKVTTSMGRLKGATSGLLRGRVPNRGRGVPISMSDPSIGVTAARGDVTVERAISLDEDSEQLTRASESSPPSSSRSDDDNNPVGGGGGGDRGQGRDMSAPGGVEWSEGIRGRSALAFEGERGSDMIAPGGAEGGGGGGGGGVRCAPVAVRRGRETGRCAPAIGRKPTLRGGRRVCVRDCTSTPDLSSLSCRVSKPSTHAKATQLMRKRSTRASVRERKVTRTVLAVLLAFLVTWTPYNAMVLVGTFCHYCVSDTLWAIGYWLCYINSTINPACYALCNITFRKTFRKLLLCQYKNISSK
ncbi:muscarinic acetylcholine receptor M2 [Engraulis encrasicolus]|uniref:muscarinic acetylcholine receptor M2 n=1 Tax=Engraulis encrasicolus TaxID=184585 RepID=UPI002FD231FB